MGIDGMRVGGGRCPPLVVAGLMVACFLLVCNWWSLSTENNELLRQIDGLSQQLKLSVGQRDEYGIQLDDIRQRYKKMEEDLTDIRMQLGHEKNAQHRLDEGLKMCNIELDSLKKLDVSRNLTMETARVEKEALEGQLETRREENKKLQEDLDRVQDELEKLKTLKTVEKTAEDAPPAGAETVLTNETKNGGNQDLQNDLDAGRNAINLDDQDAELENAEVPEPPEDDAELREDARRIGTPDVKQNQP